MTPEAVGASPTRHRLHILGLQRKEGGREGGRREGGCGERITRHVSTNKCREWMVGDKGREGGREEGKETYPAEGDDVVFLRRNKGSHFIIGNADQKSGPGLQLWEKRKKK